MDPKRVVVAVRRGQKSKATLKWVLDHSVSERDVVVLLHVRPVLKMIPTPMGDFRPIGELDDRIVAEHLQNIEAKTNQMFTKYRSICNLYRVATEFEVAEHDSVGEALVEQISRLKITMLVMGAAARCLLVRKVMGPRKFEYVATNAPDYCNVLVISNKSLILAHNSTGPPPPPPSPPPARNPPSSLHEIRSGATFGEIEEQ